MFKKTPLCLLLFSSLSFADDGFYIPTLNEVPAGFEDIAESVNLTDIYLNGVYLGTTAVGSKVESFPKDIPQSIVDAIRSKNNAGVLFESLDYIATKNAKNGDINIWDKKIKREKEQYAKTPNLRMNVHGLTQHRGSSTNQTYHFDNSFRYGAHNATFDMSQYNDKIEVRGAYYDYQTDDSKLYLGVLPDAENITSTTNYSNGSLFGFRADFNAGASVKRDPIPLLLNNAAIIQITRGQQLLKNIELPAGNHNLDVSDLPYGNYAVTIKIEYLNGTTEEIDAYLSESSNGGEAWSLKELTAGMTTDEYIGESSPKGQSPFINLDFYAMQGDNYTSAIQFVYSNEKIALAPSFRFSNSDFYVLSKAKLVSGGDWLVSNRFNVNYENSQTYISHTQFKNEYSRDSILSINHNRRLKEGSISFSAYYQDASVYKKSYQISYSRGVQLWELGRGTITSSIKYSGETTWQIGFSFGASSRSNNQNYRMDANTNSEHNYSSQHQFSNRYNYSRGTINSQISKNFNNTGNGGYSVSNRIDDSHYGSVNLQTGQTSPGKDAYLNTEFKGSLLYDGSEIHSTGDNNQTSAILIDLTESPKGMYQLRVDQTAKRIKGGELHIIPVSSGRKHSISLSNINTEGVAVTGNTENIKLRSGEIFRPKWSISKTSYIIGSITIDGKPLSNTFIKTAISEGFTDDYGFIAIEAPENSRVLKIEGGECILTPEQNLLTIGENSCKSTKNH